MELISITPYKTYKNHRQEPYFTFLRKGLKTIEGRLCKNLYAEVVTGDHIIVYNNDESESVEVEVIAVRNYDSFVAMLGVESIKKVLPDKETVEDGVALYRSFYSPEKEATFGVVAIEVRLVS